MDRDPAYLLYLDHAAGLILEVTGDPVLVWDVVARDIPDFLAKLRPLVPTPETLT